MSQYLRLRETLANNLQSKQWQTWNTSVLHLGWSSVCFTALVGLIDSQMLQTVLCFFLLPGCSSASQTSQLKTRSGGHHDSCKQTKWFCEGTFIWNGSDCQITWHPFPRLPFSVSNLVCSLKIGFVTAMVLSGNTSPPPRLEQYVLHCTGKAHRQPSAPEGLVFLSPPRLFKCLANITTSS